MKKIIGITTFLNTKFYQKIKILCEKFFVFERMEKFKIKITNLKHSFNSYFSFKNSLGNLMKFCKRFYIYSVGFDDMYYGLKNPKRLKISIMICVMLWIATFYHLLLVTSDDVWGLIDGPFVPGHYRTTLGLYLIIIFTVSVIKTDQIIGEIEYNSKPLEVFHFLMNNIKSKHKLTERNYKRLAIFSRLVQLLLLNYGATIISCSVTVFDLVLALRSNGLNWWLQSLFNTPIYVMTVLIMTSSSCIISIYLPYYKLVFDQMNIKLKLLTNGKSKVIFKNRETEFIRLIDEHNKTAIKIHEMNVAINRIAAALFICLSLAKIFSLYLVVNVKDPILKILLANIFIFFFIFGFGSSIVFSLQIKSAHQSQRLIHFILCRYRMRLSFRLKVNKINLNYN